jgi:ketosteroid isomerase-like protein
MTALVAVLSAALIAPAAAQKANIEAANAKWVEFFNKGDFDGVASLYTNDAVALPPGMAEQVSDPKITTLDIKRLDPTAAREIGTFSLKTKGPTPKEVSGKYVVIWQRIGRDWKLSSDIWNDGK